MALIRKNVRKPAAKKSAAPRSASPKSNTQTAGQYGKLFTAAERAKLNQRLQDAQKAKGQSDFIKKENEMNAMRSQIKATTGGTKRSPMKSAGTRKKTK